MARRITTKEPIELWSFETLPLVGFQNHQPMHLVFRFTTGNANDLPDILEIQDTIKRRLRENVSSVEELAEWCKSAFRGDFSIQISCTAETHGELVVAI